MSLNTALPYDTIPNASKSDWQLRTSCHCSLATPIDKKKMDPKITLVRVMAQQDWVFSGSESYLLAWSIMPSIILWLDWDLGVSRQPLMKVDVEIQSPWWPKNWASKYSSLNYIWNQLHCSRCTLAFLYNQYKKRRQRWNWIFEKKKIRISMNWTEVYTKPRFYN